MPLATAAPQAGATTPPKRATSTAGPTVGAAPSNSPVPPPPGVTAADTTASPPPPLSVPGTPATPTAPTGTGGYVMGANGQIIPSTPTPASPFDTQYGGPGWGTVGNPMAGASGLDPQTAALLNQFNAWSGNQYALNASNNGLQTGFTNASYLNNLGALTSSSQADLARLLQQQYRDVTLGKQGNQISRKYNDLGLGLAGQRYGLAGEQLGLQGQGRDQDIAGAALNRDIQYRANASDAAGRGATSTSGYTQNDRDSLHKFGLAQDAANLQYAGAELGYKGAGLDYQSAQNAHDQAGENLTLNDAALDSLGKEYGIRRGDIENQLKAATTKLGLDNASTIQQLNAAMQSGDQAIMQQAYNFLVQLMALPDSGSSGTPTPPTLYNNPSIGTGVYNGAGPTSPNPNPGWGPDVPILQPQPSGNTDPTTGPGGIVPPPVPYDPTQPYQGY